jgi:hypothetical protein
MEGWFLRFLTAACLLFLSIAKAGAANFSTLKASDGSDFVFVSGDLIVGDSQRFETIVRLKAKVVVFFDSDGGSVLGCCRFSGHHPKLTAPAFRTPLG